MEYYIQFFLQPEGVFVGLGKLILELPVTACRLGDCNRRKYAKTRSLRPLSLIVGAVRLRKSYVCDSVTENFGKLNQPNTIENVKLKKYIDID